jgi:hypothetical protein
MHGFLSNLFAGPATMPLLVIFTLGVALLVRVLLMLLVKNVARSVAKKKSLRGSIPFVSMDLGRNVPGAESTSSETTIHIRHHGNRSRSEYN